MGNSSSKDAHTGDRVHGHQTSSSQHHIGSHSAAGDISGIPVYVSRSHGGRSSRPDLSFLHLGGSRDRENDQSTTDRPRETRQEREARRAERERQNRLKERERSLKEEHVDGGFLVTLGTYTGPEDYSKPVVRQLQIERRLAPFWKGLNDHSDSWTEAQLVAAVRDLPIPAADDVSSALLTVPSHDSNLAVNVGGISVPTIATPHSNVGTSEYPLSSSQPNFSTITGLTPSASAAAGNTQLLRSRAKTFASLTTGSRAQPDEMTLREIRLPHDPLVNGQRLEAYLYKDASECPICFLYYPPYLNRTRCCDQPICSECFVQIKRPDPHPPEHEQPGQTRPPEEEAEQLVSEVAACPFCVTPEFGVTYDPPPFRRGLSYSHTSNILSRSPHSPGASSTTSLSSGVTRRRATSLSVNAPNVITTDRVRPDWAKKLADARAHALRRSAAATALHNAAYLLGNQDTSLRGGFALGRRRRNIIIETPNSSGTGTPAEGGPENTSTRRVLRRNQAQEIEDLMMAEAIRLSLAAEEDRKRKEEKEAQKEAKKKAKEQKKEEKRLEKISKRNGSSTSLYRTGGNDSVSTWGSVGMARSTSNLGMQAPIPEETAVGKGKQPANIVARTGELDHSTRPRASSSTSPPPTSSRNVTDAQRYLDESRANLHPAPSSPGRSLHFRQMSNASSVASSFMDSPPGSYRGDSNFHSMTDVTSGALNGSSQDLGTISSSTGGAEPFLNYRSLAAMIGQEEDKTHSLEHVEHVDDVSTQESSVPVPQQPPSDGETPVTGTQEADISTKQAAQISIKKQNAGEKGHGHVGVHALEHETIHETI